MIILLSIFIFLLIYLSFRLDDQKIILNKKNSKSSKYFLWQNDNKAFHLLWSSITFNNQSFSAYSKNGDSIMSFPADIKELDSLKLKFKTIKF